ncbi:MAG: nucleoside recognition domain-containing protein, partial [Cyanobacteriota bacterium]
LRGFLLRAGKVIVIMVMVLSLLNSIGTDGSFGQGDSQDSILSAASQAVTPVFAPMGIRQENWPATVGIFTGVFAKEAMVGSLDSLYNQLAQEDLSEAESAEAFNFWDGIAAAFASIPANLADIGNQILDPLGLNIGDAQDQATVAAEQEVAVGTFGQMATRFNNTPAAFAYLLFVLMYFPCFAATGAVYHETNLGWTAFVALWTTGLGYWVATVFYQIATFSQHPTFSLAWIIGSAVVMAGLIFFLRLSRSPRGFAHNNERSQKAKTTTGCH